MCLPRPLSVDNLAAVAKELVPTYFPPACLPHRKSCPNITSLFPHAVFSIPHSPKSIASSDSYLRAGAHGVHPSFEFSLAWSAFYNTPSPDERHHHVQLSSSPTSTDGSRTNTATSITTDFDIEAQTDRNSWCMRCLQEKEVKMRWESPSVYLLFSKGHGMHIRARPQ